MKDNIVDTSLSSSLSFSDCVEMMQILQHNDVKRCFNNMTVQQAMNSQNATSVFRTLQNESCIQSLLTNQALIQRISTMHVKMHNSRMNEWSE